MWSALGNALTVISIQQCFQCCRLLFARCQRLRPSRKCVALILAGLLPVLTATSAALVLHYRHYLSAIKAPNVCLLYYLTSTCCSSAFIQCPSTATVASCQRLSASHSGSLYMFEKWDADLELVVCSSSATVLHRPLPNRALWSNSLRLSAVGTSRSASAETKRGSSCCQLASQTWWSGIHCRDCCIGCCCHCCSR